MKRVFDMSGPQSVTAYALIFEGKPAGRILANWSGSGNCTASVYIFAGPLFEAQKGAKKLDFGNIGRAGGGGYDKLSSAVWSCFDAAGIATKELKPGNGQTETEFRLWGYEVFQVC